MFSSSVFKPLLTISVLSFSLQSHAAFVPYFGLGAGSGQINDGFKYDDSSEEVLAYKEGYAIESTLGLAYRAQDIVVNPVGFRAEAELSYQINAIDEIDETTVTSTYSQGMDVTVASGYLNGYIDYYTTASAVPYAFVGVGYIKAKSQSTYDDFSGESISAHIGVGIDLKLTEATSLDLKYKYQPSRTIDASDANIELETSQVMLGLRFRF
jgi:opacity protein-like surface antigen